MAQVKSYSGDLATGILLPDHNADARFYYPLTLAHESSDQKRLEQEYARKLPLLFVHYGIDPAAPDAWQRLALALAIAHVSGFQYRRVKGRKRSVSLETLYGLYQAARRKHASKLPRRLTDAAVCGWLAKDESFRASVPKLAGAGAKRLQNLLAEARDHRRANLVARIEHRRYRQRLATLPPSERKELEGFGYHDLPLWPGDPSRKRWRRLYSED